MALTFSFADTWDDGKPIHVNGTVTATGNYATNGDTLDLSPVPVIASAQAPIQGTAWTAWPGSRNDECEQSKSVRMRRDGGRGFSGADGRRNPSQITACSVWRWPQAC